MCCSFVPIESQGQWFWVPIESSVCPSQPASNSLCLHEIPQWNVTKACISREHIEAGVANVTINGNTELAASGNQNTTHLREACSEGQEGNVINEFYPCSGDFVICPGKYLYLVYLI